jgi:DNA helicase-2/ATP-dependent DNA helicase PcrA
VNAGSSSNSILKKVVLNQVQEKAVLSNDWPQLVFAGAGSGKTRVLTAKIAHLIQDCGVFPNHIFAATFTNKAAREMRERIEQLIGLPCGGLWIGTFHSLCARILRREAAVLRYTPSFTIYDQDDQISLVKKQMREQGLDERTMPPRAVLGAISHYKNDCRTPEEVQDTANNFYERQVVELYGRYQKALFRHQAMDFDDLITNTVYLLRRNPELLQRYQNLFQYVLVDEYQDTNHSQFALVELLGKSHGRIFAVGDDDQSIYGWRGARLENILSFEQAFPGAAIFKLEQNYRSTRPILDFANAVISSNRGRTRKSLWTSREGGAEVQVTRYHDDRDESRGVAETIRQITGSGVSRGDIAILFRTNAQSRSLEDALRRARIPYVLVGGTSFYERKEIKDCMAYLRLLVNPRDDVSMDRILNVPPRGIGAKSRDSLLAYAAGKRQSVLEAILEGGVPGVSGKAAKGLEELQSVFSLLREQYADGQQPHLLLNQILTLTGYTDALDNEDSEKSQARLENINELLNALALWEEENPDAPLDRFLEEVSLASDVDKWKEESESVNLMTLHCAKGLEFDIVFLVGMEDGILPSRQNLDDPMKLEEERRLLYVGATRAMQRLDCSYVQQRYRFGSLMPMEPSRFLNSISRQLYQYSDHSALFPEPAMFHPAPPPARPAARVRRTPPSRPAPGRQRTAPQGPRIRDEFSQETVEFRMGQFVSHKTYGRGKIVNISGFGPDMRLTVLFTDGARRRLLAKFLKVEG